MSENRSVSLPGSKLCPECAKVGQSGWLELIRSVDPERGKEISFALCTRKGCLYHIQKMPLFMYEKVSGEGRKK